MLWTKWPQCHMTGGVNDSSDRYLPLHFIVHQSSNYMVPLHPGEYELSGPDVNILLFSFKPLNGPSPNDLDDPLLCLGVLFGCSKIPAVDWRWAGLSSPQTVELACHQKHPSFTGGCLWRVSTQDWVLPDFNQCFLILIVLYVTGWTNWSSFLIIEAETCWHVYLWYLEHIQMCK